jgi:hypothetical protein
MEGSAPQEASTSAHPRKHACKSSDGPAVNRKKIDRKSKSRLDVQMMKTNAIAFSLTVGLLAASACFAADPYLGTWKLNEAKSKLTPGTIKNTMVTYEAVGDQIRVTAEGIDSKGKPTRSQWIGKFDGRDYPVTGDPNSTARSYKKVDDRTLEMTMTRRGYAAGTGRIVVSPDGKTRTVTTRGTDPKGRNFKNTAVYEKQ